MRGGWSGRHAEFGSQNSWYKVRGMRVALASWWFCDARTTRAPPTNRIASYVPPDASRNPAEFSQTATDVHIGFPPRGSARPVSSLRTVVFKLLANYRMQRASRLPICSARMEGIKPNDKGCAQALRRHAWSPYYPGRIGFVGLKMEEGVDWFLRTDELPCLGTHALSPLLPRWAGSIV